MMCMDIDLLSSDAFIAIKWKNFECYTYLLLLNLLKVKLKVKVKVKVKVNVFPVIFHS